MNILIFLAILATATAAHQEDYRPLNSFGMNKPHLLFHLGERNKISVNHGFAYWQNLKDSKDKNNFSKLRLYYENKKQGLYVNMVSHDGDTHVHEIIQDDTYGVDTNIRYQMLKDGWEQDIQMERKEKREINSSSTYWLTFITVENTDHSLIPQLEVTKTPIYLKLTQRTERSATISIEKVTGTR